MNIQKPTQLGLFNGAPGSPANGRAAPRYFRDDAYRRKIDDWASLKVDALSRMDHYATVLAMNPADESAVGEGSQAYRGRVKYNVLKLLDRLSETLPTRDSARSFMQERIGHYRELMRYGNPAMRAEAIKTLDDIKIALHDACNQLTPPYLSANPDDGAMLRRQSLDNQMKYVREVYQAAANEANAHNSFMSHIPNSTLLPLLREMGDLPALNALRAVLANDSHHYRQLMSHPNPRMRNSDWGYERAETLGAMRAHVEAFVERLTEDRQARFKNTPRKTDGSVKGKPGTISDLLERLQHADTLDTMLVASDALHTHVALRANFIKDDLAAAYGEDYRRVYQATGRRRIKDQPIAYEYNPFLREEEPIRAGYEARWCQIAHQAVALMDRYKGTLHDLSLKPLDRLERPDLTVVGKKAHKGQAAQKPKAKPLPPPG
ncbi:MAG: hypothetical protein ACKVOE_06715 [Rickettsiales bacterium]